MLAQCSCSLKGWPLWTILQDGLLWCVPIPKMGDQISVSIHKYTGSKQGTYKRAPIYFTSASIGTKCTLPQHLGSEMSQIASSCFVWLQGILGVLLLLPRCTVRYIPKTSRGKIQKIFKTNNKDFYCSLELQNSAQIFPKELTIHPKI